uniref:Uncharacterized protein n=1 Tax=Tanacetum cinerariifolium TaxID=118510 RepID=A0A6L2JGM1_TANCI|nr:hypothetical protein [Tanacetum cinerariifolium]
MVEVPYTTEYNVFAVDTQHYEQPECIINTCVVETIDSNVIPDWPDMCDNEIQTDQNAVECDDERVALANIIANLKLDVDENKKIQNQLKKVNASLTRELKECKSILAKTSRTLGESKSIRDSCLITLQNKQNTFERRNQSIQTIHMLAPKGPTFNGRPAFANPILVPNREETLTLKKEIQSKLNKDLVRPYNYTKLNSLYEIFKPASQEYHKQLAHANEVRKKMWILKFKPNIFKSIGFLPVSKSINKSRQAYNVMTNNINHFRELVDQAWEKHSHNHFRAPTSLDMEVLIKTCLMPLAIKTQNDSFTFVHEFKQEMHANLKYVESLENEIDELEYDKAEISNMYDIILQECVSNDVMCSYLHSLSDLDAHSELQCLYLHKVKECECLAQKLLKQTESAGLKWIPIRKPVKTRYNTNDSASQLGKKTHNPKIIICANSSSLSAGSNTLSWKPCQGGSFKLNLPNHRYKGQCCSLIPAESDSLPHANAQTTKTYYKHQDSRLKKAQEIKTKTSANSDINDPSSETKI